MEVKLDQEEQQLLNLILKTGKEKLQNVFQHLKNTHLNDFNFSMSGGNSQNNQKDEYEKQDGTLNRGREYEKLMCALYALKLTENHNVNEFKITSNDNNFGNFSDVCVQVYYSNGNNHSFLFQLKHQDKPKPIEQKCFITNNKKNDYFLDKYFEAIPDVENATFIIFTNRSVNIELDTIFLNKFKVKKCQAFKFDEVLIDDTLETLFEFTCLDTETVIHFFAQQKGVEDIESLIKVKLQQLLSFDVYSSFYHYINEWWSGTFKLTKSDFIAKLTELALAPFLKHIPFSQIDGNCTNLIEAVMSFDVTIIKNVKNNTIDKLWAKCDIDNDKRDSIVRKFVITDFVESKVLWYLGRIPLIVKVNNKNKLIVEKVIKLLGIKKSDRKIVLICKNIDRGIFNNLKIFENLSDLHNELYEKIVDNLYISIQGKSKVSLKQLIMIDKKFETIIEVDELLQMSMGDLTIGDLNTNPDFYIPRTVSITLYKTDDILESFKDVLIIFNCDSSFRLFLKQYCINVIELKTFLNGCDNEYTNNLILISTKTKCTSLQFQEVCQQTNQQNVYLFDIVDSKCCALQFIKGKKPLLEGMKKTISEDEIFTQIDNNLNIFCAPPGMGRSTLMKVLSLKSSGITWALYVDLIRHNSNIFSKSEDDILKYFLEVQQASLLNNFKKLFLENRKINIFLDGLHEVDNNQVNLIINFAKNVSSQGVKVWISLRDNLQEKIIGILKVVPIQIEEFSEVEQKMYIKERLKLKYKPEEIQKIFEIVFNSAKINNSQDLLGNPLQLHIITETFYNSRKIYETSKKQNILVLTKMYQLFFEGKKNAEYNKIGLLRDYNNFENILEQYEVLALKSSLNERDFNKLAVKDHQNKRFVEELKKNGDKFGIIKNTYKNGKVVFTHQTYADYFAAVWFKKNQSKIHLLLDDLYLTKYENLRFMIHVMLAENNPLLLAFIYKDREKCRCHKTN